MSRCKICDKEIQPYYNTDLCISCDLIQYDKRRKKEWDNSKDHRYLVVINIGGGLGLYGEIIEVRSNKDMDYYWSLSGNIDLDKDGQEYKSCSFATREEAKIFLNGIEHMRKYIIDQLGGKGK